MGELNNFLSWLKVDVITEEILIFILFVPIIATLVNVSRYIIGFRTFGIYAPMILSFSYIFTGIRYGLLVTVAVIVSTLLSHTLLKNIRMHYMSRITINYTITVFMVLIILALNEISPWSITTEQHTISAIPPLGIILIITLSDFFIKQYIKKDLLTTIRSLVETVIIACIGWLLLTINELQNFLINNIWILIPLLILNFLIGQYKSLSIKELFRFKKDLSDNGENE